MLFDIAWKASATALAIVLVAKLGERSGALLASVAMTFPMNAGPGFLFIALEQSAAFVRAGALVSFAATGAVLAFVATFVTFRYRCLTGGRRLLDGRRWRHLGGIGRNKVNILLRIRDRDTHRIE